MVKTQQCDLDGVMEIECKAFPACACPMLHGISRFKGFPSTMISIWGALGGNTRNLDSIWEETGQDYNFTRSGFKHARIVPGDGVTIPSDAIKTYKQRLQDLCNSVRT
ncbi:hypothetical protein Tco_1497878 [Tanacetum coccineum]